jgi:hypothetical protein
MPIYILFYLIIFTSGVIIVILFTFYRSEIKWKLWEKAVSKYLSKLNNTEYFIINDVFLKYGDETFQVDHLIISQYWIFVIETKNYIWRIFWDEYSQQWCQSIYGNKNYFHNPIHQNYWHIKKLSELLDIPENKFINIVAFGWDCNIKGENFKSIVCYSECLIEEIKEFNQIIVSNQEISKIVDYINLNNIKNKKERKNHIKRIRKKYKT